MKKILFGTTLVLLYSLQAQINLNKIKDAAKKVGTTSSVSSLSESEIIQGLKEALTQGSGIASQALNKQDGYFKNPKVKIPFPEDAVRVATTLRNAGLGKQVDEFEMLLNRAAEDAAKEAAPIFKSAVTNMTFKDAKNILTGPDTAATGYLRKTTYSNLFSAFSPHINKALQARAVTAKWKDLTTAYNKIPMTKKVNTDLVGFTTHKALKGLFMMVADEELKIRKDPLARTTSILQKVFGASK
ncbi:MAG: DUF4197 domain-containing protein [Cytophagaceae bacterium]|nr:DUF4197 domain-containing protein [Cytophagaceae bacterium]